MLFTSLVLHDPPAIPLHMNPNPHRVATSFCHLQNVACILHTLQLGQCFLRQLWPLLWTVLYGWANTSFNQRDMVLLLHSLSTNSLDIVHSIYPSKGIQLHSIQAWPMYFGLFDPNVVCKYPIQLSYPLVSMVIPGVVAKVVTITDPSCICPRQVNLFGEHEKVKFLDQQVYTSVVEKKRVKWLQIGEVAKIPFPRRMWSLCHSLKETGQPY